MARKKKDVKYSDALNIAPAEGISSPVNPKGKARRKRTVRSVAEYFHGIRQRDRVLLSQAITLLESTRPDHQDLARKLLDRCIPYSGNSIRVGITGVPGAGKSTFIEALGTTLTDDGHRLAVLTIDPSSERTKGSILGDKTRMASLAADERAYIRPSPTSGFLGGVANTTRETIILCEAAGYDVIFIETVGVGQSEVAVRSMVDFFLLLTLAGGGDELQGIKRGVVEMADAICITKADGSNKQQALEARSAYRSALNLFPTPPSGIRPPVLLCSSTERQGLQEVWATIENFRISTEKTGFFAEQRSNQANTWLHRTLEKRLRDLFFADPQIKEAMPSVEEKVSSGALSVSAAVEQLLKLRKG